MVGEIQAGCDVRCPAVSLDEAAQLQRAYHEERFCWVHDPENRLEPWPKQVGRPPKRKPEPATHDGADPELG